MAIKIKNILSSNVLMNSICFIGYIFRTAITVITDNLISIKVDNVYVLSLVKEKIYTILYVREEKNDSELFYSKKYDRNKRTYDANDTVCFGP